MVALNKMKFFTVIVVIAAVSLAAPLPVIMKGRVNRKSHRKATPVTSLSFDMGDGPSNNNDRSDGIQNDGNDINSNNDGGENINTAFHPYRFNNNNARVAASWGSNVILP